MTGHDRGKVRLSRRLLASSLASVLSIGAKSGIAATMIPALYSPSDPSNSVAFRDNASPPRAIDTTLPVTSCADDGSPGTLRAVIMQAVEGSVIDLSALACSTITLTQGAIDISSAGPHPVGYLTIHGPGSAALTIDGSDHQVFIHGRQPAFAGTLQIDSLTIAHGRSESASAACIASTGNLVMDHVSVTDCHTVASESVIYGGAIGAFGDLILTSSAVSGSGAQNLSGPCAGGGVFVKGEALLRASIVTGNTVEGSGAGSPTYFSGGGGLFVVGDLHIVASTISMNSATDTSYAFGGGVLGLRNVTVEGSLISDNTASLGGGGLFKSNDTHDMDHYSRGVRIINSTISGNSAQLDGGLGGLYSMAIENSTITHNHATHSTGGVYFLGDSRSLLIHSSIISGNTAVDTSSHAADLSARGVPIYGTVVYVAGNHNVIGSSDSLIVLPTDTLSSDPMLAPLANNGGPTLTHALLPGSPAIDAGDNFFGFGTDQRGFLRVAGLHADVGAFELAQPQYDQIFANGFD